MNKTLNNSSPRFMQCLHKNLYIILINKRSHTSLKKIKKAGKEKEYKEGYETGKPRKSNDVGEKIKPKRRVPDAERQL